MFDLYDTHQTVEAWVDGKWTLYDPTFHLTLKVDGKRVGAFEAREWFIKGRGKPVELEFLGEVKYPARVDNYPLRYEILFNNIYVDLDDDMGPIRFIPFVGPWITRNHMYLSSDIGLSTMPQNFYRFLYNIVLIVIPVINLLLFLGMVLLWRKARCLRQ